MTRLLVVVGLACLAWAVIILTLVTVVSWITGMEPIR